MNIKPVFPKVKVKFPVPKPVTFKDKLKVNSSITSKGTSKAFVKKDNMPVSYEPIGSPRSKTLAQTARSIKNG